MMKEDLANERLCGLLLGAILLTSLILNASAF
jgi:hypothetical protein